MSRTVDYHVKSAPVECLKKLLAQSIKFAPKLCAVFSLADNNFMRTALRAR
jgi:hypothetical protein